MGPIALFRNDGRGNFADVTGSSGVQFENEGANGWSFGDLDNDSDLDPLRGEPRFQALMAKLRGNES